MNPAGTSVAVLFLVALAQPAMATEHYVRAGATGTGTGDNWTNAWTELPDSLTRGDTYYIADGDYDAVRLGEPERGSEVITVKKATLEDHGASADWNSAWGRGQATFPQVIIATDYWVFDGAVGSGGDKGSYGFAMRTDTSGQDQQYVIISAGHTKSYASITLRHIAIECSGPADNVGQVGIYCGTQSTLTAPVYQHLYVDNCSNALTMIGSDWLIEQSYFGRAWSSALHHGEQIDSWGTSHVTFRYNVVMQCAGTTCIGNDSIDDWDIYGNVFANIATGNGVIGAAGGAAVTRTRIYNNTIVHNRSTSFLYQNNPGLGAGSDNVVINNLFYDSNGNSNDNGAGAVTLGFNAYFDCPSATTVQTDLVASGDPFVSSAAGDYHPAAATPPGQTLPSPYDLDLEGHPRGADQVWDRGAFEYCGIHGCGGADAGPTSDAESRPLDASEGTDAGQPDAGGPEDASSPTDTGATDAAVAAQSDANEFHDGALKDGSATDAAGSAPTQGRIGGSCGCQAASRRAGGSGPILWFLLALRLVGASKQPGAEERPSATPWRARRS